MIYTFVQREFRDNRIKTYYNTDLQIGDERLSAIHRKLYNGIKNELGIKNDSSAVMAVLSDGNTYSLVFLELVSHPYIEYLPRIIRKGKKSQPKNIDEKLIKLAEEAFEADFSAAKKGGISLDAISSDDTIQFPEIPEHKGIVFNADSRDEHISELGLDLSGLKKI